MRIDAIEQWLCAVEDHPFDDVKNSNPRNRLKGVDNRRAVLWALGEWAYEHGTIHPAPGMAELSQRSGINPGRVSKHLRAEAKMKRFVRLVRRGEKGNPRTAQRRATEYKMMVDSERPSGGERIVDGRGVAAATVGLITFSSPLGATGTLTRFLRGTACTPFVKRCVVFALSFALTFALVMCELFALTVGFWSPQACLNEMPRARSLSTLPKRSVTVS